MQHQHASFPRSKDKIVRSARSRQATFARFPKDHAIGISDYRTNHVASRASLIADVGRE